MFERAHPVDRHADRARTAQPRAATRASRHLRGDEIHQVVESLRDITRSTSSTWSADATTKIRRLDRGEALPAEHQAGIEDRTGVSVADVRVHHDSPEPARIGAHAFTRGDEIFVGPQQRHLVPHEAWHVVQQRQGRVRPTTQLPSGEAVNDDVRLEHEADTMGADLGRMRPATAAPPARTRSVPVGTGVVQGKWSRMSTVLDDDDVRTVEEIGRRANRGEWVKAFWLVVQPFDRLAGQFTSVLVAAQQVHGGAAALDEVLARTFLEPGAARTAWEVVELLEAEPRLTPDDPDDPFGAGADDDVEDDGGHAEEGMDATDLDPEIDELIRLFRELTITVPFHSEVDRGREDHAVTLQHGDIIVASNPKPLKTVIAAGTWEGFPLQPPIVALLTTLRRDAKKALYRISGKGGKQKGGGRTITNMSSLHAKLVAIANVLAGVGGTGHAATLILPQTDLSTSDNYRSTAVESEGVHVVANPLSINSPVHGSKPKDGRLMTSIRNLAGPKSKAYKQMHLLNDLVFGPGETWNLTPGPTKSNNEMESKVEDPLKRAVLGKGLVLRFEAVVTYRNDPTTASKKEIDQSPDKYRFDHIDFRATQLVYDPTTTSWQVAARPDPDVAAIDGARVNWKYGGLPPLVTKPRILDPGTTWEDLNAVGLPPAAAKRIAAFVKAKKGTWQPTSGTNKQGQLLEAVSAHDGKRKPSSNWKATSVYWT